MTTRQQLKIVREALADYDNTFLDCRDLRHAWKRMGVYHGQGEIIRKLVCMRCKTERTDHWTARADRIRCDYKYPDGYEVTGQGRITPDLIRKEELARTTIYDTEQQMLDSLFENRRRPAARKVSA